jgi:hypothetical protein
LDRVFQPSHRPESLRREEEEEDHKRMFPERRGAWFPSLRNQGSLMVSSPVELVFDLVATLLVVWGCFKYLI